MLKLENLTAGAQVVGIEPVGLVTLEPVGADAATVVYRTGEGAAAERMLFHADELRTPTPWTIKDPRFDPR